MHFLLLQSNQQPTTSTSGLVLNQHYDCSLCLKSFTTRSLLTRHLKNHTLAASNSPPTSSSSSSSPSSEANLVNFRCDQGACGGRVFANQISLVKHIKTIHEVVSASDVISGSPEGVSKPRVSEKRFQCGQCNKRFPTSKDLKRHEVVHTGNRDFQCSFCSHR